MSSRPKSAVRDVLESIKPIGGHRRQPALHDAPIPALSTLQEVRAAVTAWQSDYARGIAPAQRTLATQRIATAGELLAGWKRVDEGSASDDDKKEAEDLAEQIKVAQTRVSIVAQPSSTKPLPNRPLLAWGWCEKNVERGTLLDGLKKTLPAYEQAAATLNKNPSATALADAEKKLGAVQKALDEAAAHYAKTEKGDKPSPKAAQATELAMQAARQAASLAVIKGRLGEFDPKTAGDSAKKGLTDGRAARKAAAEDLRDKKRLAVEASHAEMVQSIETTRDKLELKALADFEKEKEAAGTDGAALKKAQDKLAATRANNKRTIDNFLARGDASRASGLQEVEVLGREVQLAELTWAACSQAIPKGTPLYTAIEKVLPKYEAARLAFDKEPSAKTTQAALDALWAVQSVIDKAGEQCEAEAAKLPTEGPKLAAANERRAVLTLAKNLGRKLSAILRTEATLLQAAEADLPQARMARAVMETPGGAATLDSWVAELGGQAKTPEDKARVRAALKARYGLETLEGEMSTKALPRLYDVLGRVPDRQTTTNDSLKMVVRNRSDFVPSGYYDGDERKMHLDVGRTGRSGLTKQLFGVALPFVEKPPNGWKDSGLKKPKTSDVFDHLTLHEIGHSVDDQMDFMGRRMGNAAYGGWAVSSSNEVRDIGGNAKGFYAAFDLPRDFLEGYLDEVLAHRDPQESDALARKLGDKTADWSALAKHAGAAFCKSARLGSGAIGEVTQWDKKAKDALHDGRVYQEAYAGDWYSYAVAARSRGIGGYQFRAPGEWFSEIYANYYGGRLQSSHPDYAWMKALVDTE